MNRNAPTTMRKDQFYGHAILDHVTTLTMWGYARSGQLCDTSGPFGGLAEGSSVRDAKNIHLSKTTNGQKGLNHERR